MGVLDRLQRGGSPPPGEQATANLLHARVEEGFSLLMRAWGNRDPDALRPHVSSAYLKRAREGMARLDRDLRLQVTEDDELYDVAVEPPGPQPAGPLSAYVSFAARYWTVDLRTGKVIGSKPRKPRVCTARWTFVFESPHGWVADRLETVWRAPDTRRRTQEWIGLPPGWYSRRERRSEWRHWDGAKWGGVTRGGPDPVRSGPGSPPAA